MSLSNEGDAQKKSHKFWSTQPVVQSDQVDNSKEIELGPLETKTVAEVRQEPYPLPNGESLEYGVTMVTERFITL